MPSSVCYATARVCEHACRRAAAWLQLHACGTQHPGGHAADAPEDVSRDAGRNGAVAEDASATGLGELASLVVEILGHTDLPHHRPRLPAPHMHGVQQLHRGKERICGGTSASGKRGETPQSMTRPQWRGCLCCRQARTMASAAGRHAQWPPQVLPGACRRTGNDSVHAAAALVLTIGAPVGATGSVALACMPLRGYRRSACGASSGATGTEVAAGVHGVHVWRTRCQAACWGR
jgi:hypothetical protein